MSTLGAILAGGSSSRMGADKADVDVGGLTMLQRVSRAIQEVLPEVVLLGEDRTGFVCWPDQVDAAGPLAGITTALLRSAHPRVLIVAVDNAFVRSDTLAGLLSVASKLPVVPVDRYGVRQVTCAVYPASIATVAAEEAGGGGSIQTLIDRVSFEPVTPEVWGSWGEDGRSWFSLDTTETLEEGLRRYS
jgi:molybdenum cofactor guanylyltransferase